MIRRLSFDLIGLPPSLEDIDAFVGDPAPDAYERLVDRLLASPQHGERWARHWLDVVHYGDTHGYDKDQPRPNAWPYRDYVIRAFNADKPYGRFVSEQVAGDVLYPDTVDGITAIGFIAAGPWDLIGHAEVPETKIDGKIARHLDRDDMVANTINTFVSLTVQCAQCHNHKFDPIRQEDYYRLQAVFAALDRADRPYHTDPAVGAQSRRAERVTRGAEAAAGRAKPRSWRRPAETHWPSSTARSPRPASRRRPEPSSVITAASSRSRIRPNGFRWTWAAPQPIDRVVLWGCHDDFNNIGAGFGFPVRFKIEASDDPSFRGSVRRDRGSLRFRPGQSRGRTPVVSAHMRSRGRYIRVTATKLAPRQNDYNFALAELEVLDAIRLEPGPKCEGFRDGHDRGPPAMAGRRTSSTATPLARRPRRLWPGCRPTARTLIARVTDRQNGASTRRDNRDASAG